MIDNSTTALLSMALDAAVMRQQAIAHNIANVNTPNYQRLSVSFEQRLESLRDSRGQLATPSMASLAHLQPVLEAAEDAAPVALDEEMTALSATTLHHQTLLKALTKQFALLGMAINEGKR